MTSCSFGLGPELFAPRIGNAQILCRTPVIDSRVFFVVSREFREFVFSRVLKHREFGYTFGDAARGSLRALLHSCFRNLRTEEISSSRISIFDARDRFARTQEFDYVAVIRFSRASMTAEGIGVNLSLSIEVEFLARSGAQSFALEGEGASRSPTFGRASLQRAGDDALGGVLVSLREEFEEWRELLDLGMGEAL
jgi:hypothetical protein